MYGTYAQWIIAQDGIYDPAAATARGLAYRKGGAYVFSVASLRKWRVDRSTGFLKVVRAESKPKAPAMLKQALKALEELVAERANDFHHETEGFNMARTVIATARQLAA